MAAQETIRAEEADGPRFLRWFVVVAVALLTAIALVVWLLGGFERRRDYAQAAPGEEIDAGSLVFVLNSATAQQNREAEWEVVVKGTVRNPNDEPIAPASGPSGNLAVLTESSRASAVLESAVLGGARQRSYVPPGNRPIELEAEFIFPAGTTFGDTVDCGVIAFEYSDNSVLGISGGEKTWHSDSSHPGTLVTLPLTVLPPQE